MASFKYQPLQQPDSIRLLQLQGASRHEEHLIGVLRHVALGDCDYDLVEPYTALSYVWADPKNQGMIRLDGYNMVITATLDAALRYMREKSRIRLIWPDALCIDQANIRERNRQVAMMGEIYSTAHHTIIHLGNSTPEIIQLFQRMRWRPAELKKDETATSDKVTGCVTSNISENLVEFKAIRSDLLGRP